MCSPERSDESREPQRENDRIIRTLARRVHDLIMSNRRREAELVRLRRELQRLRRSPIPVRPRDT